MLAESPWHLAEARDCWFNCVDFQGKIKCIQKLKKYFTAYAKLHTITVVNQPNKKVDKSQKEPQTLHKLLAGNSILVPASYQEIFVERNR